MSSKFGWEKANRRDAARRAQAPQPKGFTPSRRKRKPKPKHSRPAMFYRYQCPQCRGFQVAVTKPLQGQPGYHCPACEWRSSIEPTAVLCRTTSQNTFQPLMAKGPSAPPTVRGRQEGAKRMRSPAAFDNGAFGSGLGYRPPCEVSDRTTALGNSPNQGSV